MNKTFDLLNPRRSTFDSIAKIDNDIDDELAFHIDCKTLELIGDGMNEQEARQAAESAFGSVVDIRKDCQRIGYGYRIWLSRFLILFLIASIGTIIWLSIKVVSMRSANLELANQLNAAASSMANVVPVTQDDVLDIKGEVVDAEGNAVADAKVLLIYKSWPNGRFMMQNFDTTTGDDGKYVFEGVYDNATDVQILVSVIAEGHCLTSDYIENKRNKYIKDVNLKLAKADAKTFVFLDDAGTPMANTDIALYGRNATNGKEQMIYPISFADSTFTTDDDGKLKLDFFVNGDTAKFYITDSEKEIVVAVDEKAEQVVGSGGRSLALTGVVQDPNGKPVESAKAILVFKSWPNGKFKMDTKETSTDSSGMFTFPNLYSLEMNTEFKVNIFADGYQMVDEYVSNQKRKEIPSFNFKMSEAMSKTLILKDGKGEVVAEEDVYVMSRLPEGSKKDPISVYPVSAAFVTQSTDSEGRVEFNYLAKGDKVEFSVTQESGEKTTFEVVIDGEAEQQVDISKKKAKNFR